MRIDSGGRLPGTLWCRVGHDDGITVTQRAGVVPEPSGAGFRQALCELASLDQADLVVMGANTRAYYDEHLALGRSADEFENILADVARAGR